jgi:protein-L-isoaspartate(D-aspartate) O-methyltransferase
MVKEQIIARGIKDKRVINAMEHVDRSLFIPEALQELAYEDSPLPIGYGQTISQPFIVAFMVEAAKIEPEFKVLEIGTGSGYQAAVLSNLCHEVYSIELIRSFGQHASKLLKQLGYKNVHVKIGDGYKGWQEVAPFDAIIVTAAPQEIPELLVKQLKYDAKLIIPVGIDIQELMRITREKNGIKKEKLIPVKFVPMIKKT